MGDGWPLKNQNWKQITVVHSGCGSCSPQMPSVHWLPATTGRVANLVASIHWSHTTAPSWDIAQQARHTPRKIEPGTKRRIPLEIGSKLTREKTTEGQVPLPVNSVNHPKFDCSNCTRPSRMCFWSCYCMGTLYIGGHNQKSLVCHKTQSFSNISFIYIYIHLMNKDIQKWARYNMM